MLYTKTVSYVMLWCAFGLINIFVILSEELNDNSSNIIWRIVLKRKVNSPQETENTDDTVNDLVELISLCGHCTRLLSLDHRPVWLCKEEIWLKSTMKGTGPKTKPCG